MKRNAFLAVVTALVVVTLMYVVYTFHQKTEASALDEERNEGQIAAAAISRHIEYWFAERNLDLRALAEALASGEEPAAALERFAHASSGNGIVAAAVYAANGDLLAFVGPEPPSIPRGRQSSQPALAELITARSTGRPTIGRIALRSPERTIVADVAIDRPIAASVGHAIGSGKWKARVLTFNGIVVYDSAHAAKILREIGPSASPCGVCHATGPQGANASQARTVDSADDEISVQTTAGLDRLLLTVLVRSTSGHVRRRFANDIILTMVLFAALLAALMITWAAIYRSERRRIQAEAAARLSEERLTLQQAVLDAEQHCRAIVDSSHDSILVMDSAGVVKFANPQAREFFGDSPAPLEAVPSASREKVRAAIGECAGGKTVTFEAALETTAGERFLAFNAAPYVEDGVITGVVAAGRDLTESRRDEELLRESERRLKTMLNDSDTLSLLGDVRGIVTFCSDALLRLLRRNAADVIGQHWIDFVAPEDRDRIQRTLIGKLPTGTYPRHAEFNLLTAEEERRLTQWVRTVLRDDAGRPVGFGAVGQDLTARRLSEERIIKLKDFYERILEKTVAGVLVTDRTDRTVYVNSSFSRSTGLTVDDASGPTLLEHIPTLASAYVAARSGLHPVPFETIPIDGADGRTRFHTGWMVPLTIDAAFDGMICTTEDVTDRVVAERELGSLRKKHEDLVSTIPGIVWQSNLKTSRADFVSAYAERLLGYTAEQFCEPNFWIEHIHPDDRDRTLEETMAAIASPSGRALEFRFLAADGRVLWLQHVFTVVEEDGKPAKLQGVTVDITERKEVERALAESESRFRALFEQSAIGIAVQSRERRELETNLAFQEMFGYSGDELSTTARAHVVGASVRSFVRQVFDTLWNGQEAAIQREQAFKRRGGEQIWCRVTASLIRDENQSPRMTVALFEDITVRMIAEEALERGRRKFRDLVEITTDWVWEVDAAFVYTYVGPRVYEILGYEGDGVVGRTPFDFMPPDEATRMRALFEGFAAERKPFALVENVNLHREGRCVILESSGVPRYDSEGQFAGYHGINRDVTAREESKRIQRRLGTAIAQSTEVVIVTDRDGRIEYANPAFEKVSGYRLEEVTGLTSRILENGSRGDDFYASLWTQLRNGRPWSGRITNRRKDGSEYEVDASVSPILEDDGEISGFALVERDMTEHSALLERLHRAEEMERIGRLISGVAHEVRNPLNAIQAALAAMELDLGENDDNERLFAAIRSQVTRLADLMRELLEFSKPIERSRVERCSVDALCAEAIFLWRYSHPEQPSERVCLQPLGYAAFVEVEPVRMQQALINLLDNAHQHSPADGEIIVRVDVDDRGVHIRIIDCGGGIRPEHKARVFDPFFTTRRGGTGLGLSLVKNIVEQHGGRIGLENNDPRPGCTAEITLMACAVEEPEDDASEVAAG